MMNNTKTVGQMVHGIHTPGIECIRGLNLLYELLEQNGLGNDPKYVEASTMILNGLHATQNAGCELVQYICERDSVIESVKKNPIGKHVINKVIKDLGF